MKKVTIELLKKYDLDKINKPMTLRNFTLLHLAVYHKRNEVVEWLLQNGADKTAKAADGTTPVDTAHRCGNVAAINIFNKY